MQTATKIKDSNQITYLVFGVFTQGSDTTERIEVPDTIRSCPAWRSGLAKLAAGGDAFGFGDGDGGAGGDGREALELTAGPANFDGICLVALAEAKGKH